VNDRRSGDVALAVIDMLNPYDHEDADELASHVADIVEPLSGLIEEACSASGVHVIYVNDNYGEYAATREDLVANALEGRHPEIVEPIIPPEGVPFLQKARHSAFYSTALDHLLRERDITTIVLTGQVTEQCILYSALDAYVRHFDIRVPRDAVAPIDRELGDAAVRMMERNMRVDTCDAAEVLSRPRAA
jgi:nicotinamidase-related amidase